MSITKPAKAEKTEKITIDGIELQRFPAGRGAEYDFRNKTGTDQLIEELVINLRSHRVHGERDSIGTVELATRDSQIEWELFYNKGRLELDLNKIQPQRTAADIVTAGFVETMEGRCNLVFHRLSIFDEDPKRLPNSLNAQTIRDVADRLKEDAAGYADAYNRARKLEVEVSAIVNKLGIKLESA